jgi:hypothetical protein
MILRLVICVLVALICAALAAAFLARKAVEGNKGAMEKLARAFGLPLMRGERARPGRGMFNIGPWTYFILDLWNGRELNVYQIVKGAGKAQVVYAALDVPVDYSKEFRLSFFSGGGYGSSGVLQGVSLVSSGDEAFDTRIMIKTSDESVVRRILTPELRAAILRIWNDFDVRGALSIRDGRIHYEENGWIQSDAQRKRFVAVASVANRLADALSPAMAERV